MRGWVLAFILLGSVTAEQLPVRVYSTADGLANNTVWNIVPDPGGFVWFATSEGVSRFEGQSFTTFGVGDGLPDRTVWTFLPSHGQYWVGTRGGVARLTPDGHLAFEAVPSAEEHWPAVTALAEGPNGTIWAGAKRGLYRIERRDRDRWRMDLVDQLTYNAPSVSCFLKDRSGALWIGVSAGLFRRLPDGGIESFGQMEGLAKNDVETLMEDQTGRIWVGTRTGLYRLVTKPKPGAPAVEHRFTAADGLGHDDVKCLLQTPDGTIWVGTLRNGLTTLIPSGDRFQARVFSIRNGLPDDAVISLAYDQTGSIWAGTASAGVARISPNGFTRYTGDDGLPGERLNSVFETRSGQVCATNDRLAMACSDGRGFRTVQLKYPVYAAPVGVVAGDAARPRRRLVDGGAGRSATLSRRERG